MAAQAGCQRGWAQRYDSNRKPIGREVVVLLQHDAQTKGAERVILLTLSRFTEPACKSATMTISVVNFIDGDRLVAPIREDGEFGVSLQTTVGEGWFDAFDQDGTPITRRTGSFNLSSTTARPSPC